jgi:hypothetical protein
MPETPDFKKLAHEIAAQILSHRDDQHVVVVAIAEDLEEQLRQVWNARGAADLAKIESELTSQMGATASGPYLKNLDRALRSLDR